MRISDWSSDVCSSDLRGDRRPVGEDVVAYPEAEEGAEHAVQEHGDQQGDHEVTSATTTSQREVMATRQASCGSCVQPQSPSGVCHDQAGTGPLTYRRVAAPRDQAVWVPVRTPARAWLLDQGVLAAYGDLRMVLPFQVGRASIRGQ